MKIEVQNNIPGVKVSVNQNADSSFAILLAEMAGKTLGSVKPGDTIKVCVNLRTLRGWSG